MVAYCLGSGGMVVNAWWTVSEKRTWKWPIGVPRAIIHKVSGCVGSDAPGRSAAAGSMGSGRMMSCGVMGMVSAAA